MATASVRAAGPGLPPDDILGGLDLLLDAGAVRDRLRGAGNDLEGGVLFYLKYKPRTSCIAAYEFRSANGARALYYGKCLAPSQFSLACHKASHHRWTEPASGPPVLTWPEATTVLYAFPNDARLDGLRVLARPRKVRRLVAAQLPRLRSQGLVTELVRYKPERRAVLRSGNGGDTFYWRAYADAQGAEVFRRMAVLARSGVKAPRPYAYVPERQILAIEALPGRPLDELIAGEAAVSSVAGAAEALAALHAVEGQGLAPRSAEDALAAAGETRDTLSWLSKEAGAQAARIVERLRSTAPDPSMGTAFVHGDFHPAQVLVGSDGAFLLDFDRSHLGSPCADLGGFLAHLRLARLEGRVRDEEALAGAFRDAYAARSRRFPAPEVKWWTALGLLLLAVTPFRRLQADWPGQVVRILASSEEKLC